MSTEHLEMEVANTHILVKDLLAKVDRLEATKSAGGVIMPPNVVTHPTAAPVSRAEFERVRGALVNEIEGLKAELAMVSEIAFEAVRILDRMSGMGE